MRSRTEVLAQVRHTEAISVLIVGGGINGAALFRELALQGVDVLLVDKSDFCAGASSAPSRMIHGGLRYLENGEFGLVRESLRERNILLKNASHYVKPLPTTIPIFSRFSGFFPAIANFFGRRNVPSNRGAVLIKIGLTLYDLLVFKNRVLPRHRFLSRQKALTARPALNPAILCTATYYDAWISYPERLCLEIIEDAEAGNNRANALNYAAMVSGAQDSVVLCDELSGEQFRLKPRIMVNATGAWIDFINQALLHETALIGGTKGSHLIIDNSQLFEALCGEMLFYENVDNRICIMFPLLGKVLAGSTDIRVNHPDGAMTTEDDIRYILESIRQVFPSIPVQRSEIVFHFCGVRPLPRQITGTTGQISRNHVCSIIEPTEAVHFPVYSLIGGKWTTFRAFAEQVADKLLPRLGLPRRTDSDKLPIGGGRDFPASPEAIRMWLARLGKGTQLSAARLEMLLQRYGTRAEQVANFTAKTPDQPLQHHADYSRREIEFLVANERVVHLDDLVLRRTTLAMQGELTVPLLNELAAIMALLCGWHQAELIAEVERCCLILKKNHGLTPEDNERANHVQLNQSPTQPSL